MSEQPSIYIPSKGGRLPAKTALLHLSDEMIRSGDFSARTVIDLKNLAMHLILEAEMDGMKRGRP